MRKLNIIQFSIIILTITLLSGCKAPEAYSNALDAFSSGATLEMKDRFPAEDAESGAELPGDFMFFDDLYATSKTADPSKAFTDYYKEALDYANTALKGASQLKKNKMLDNAYAIKALILWRQTEFDAAKTTASEAEPLLSHDSGQENDVRDLAMMQALPGLINVEKAYQALERSKAIVANLGPLSIQGADERQAAYEEIKGLYQDFVISETDGATSIKRGLDIIDRAIDNVDDNSAIVLYLKNAQLAGLDTWGDVLANVFIASRRLSVSEFAPDAGTWVSTEREKYELEMNNTLLELSKLLSSGENHKLYKYWKKTL